MTIIESYVRDLIEDSRTTMVALYVSKLPQNLQIEWYARFLEGECCQLTKETICIATPQSLNAVIKFSVETFYFTSC